MKPNALSNGEPKNVGIWIRVSTEDQAEGDSPEHHLERAKAYCQVRGWTVKEVYDLAGQSGKAVREHPEAKRMMKDVERRHITGLVFSKLARLSRNRRELEDFSDFFKNHNADLISLSEAIDTSTAGGRMFFHLLGVFAQWEREEIAERVTASVITRAKLGKRINGTAPYGYKWQGRDLLPVPEEAAIRRKAYELFLAHRRKGKVAALLNEAGYRTRQGKPWHDMPIERMLTDPSAKGVYVFNKFKRIGDWKNEPKPESEWGRVTCPAIVPEEVWNEVNQIIEGRYGNKPKPGKSPVHLFSGLLECSCGSRMYVRANYPKYLCRKCSNKIQLQDIDEVFHQSMKAFFAQPERIAEHLKEAQKNLAEKEQLLKAHEDEIQKVRDEMNRTHKLYLEGQITSQGFGQFYKPAEERLNQLNQTLPKLQADVDYLRVNNLSTDEILHEATTLYDRWPELPFDDKRKIAESLVEKITLGNNEINITWSYRPTSTELCKNQQRLVPL